MENSKFLSLRIRTSVVRRIRNGLFAQYSFSLLFCIRRILRNANIIALQHFPSCIFFFLSTNNHTRSFHRLRHKFRANFGNMADMMAGLLRCASSPAPSSVRGSCWKTSKTISAQTDVPFY